MPPSRRARAPGGADRSSATRRPVARVAVDVPLAHLDRPFDYVVTEAQSAAAAPGVRVRVRFAGRLVDGFVLDRLDASDHPGRLARLDRVLGDEPVLVPEVARLVREVADGWAGTFADVVRLAVPPRHAATEQAAPITASPLAPPPGDCLDRYVDGRGMLSRLARPEPVRRVMTMLPGGWDRELASLAAASAATGRGVVIVAPDARDVRRLDEALTAVLGTGAHVALTADLGPAERYRRFLAVSRGRIRVVVGTRAAVWAPVRELGLLVVWDDGNDLYAEPRAPYCHARDVAVVRAHRAGSSLLLAGHAVTAEGALLVQTGWAQPWDPTGAARSAALPVVRATGADEDVARDPGARTARIPSVAWRAAHDGLAAGPVLVQVPRRGYQPAVACGTCRSPARCVHCAGPLERPRGAAAPRCRWCGAAALQWRCRLCGSAAMRAAVVGADRTAEELGRAFPGVPIRTSGGDAVIDRVPDRPALVVATPGAEPSADGGYAAALLLDGWALLARPDLRSGEEALRRWLTAAALVRSAVDGGSVVVVAAAGLRPVQALLRWQPRWHAERELADRQSLHLPPAGRMASLTATPAAVAELVGAVTLPGSAEVLGPVPAGREHPDQERLLIRVPRRDGRTLAAALKAGQAIRSARKASDPVRVQLDPDLIG